MYEKDDSSQKRFINFCWRYKSFFFFYNKGWNFHCSDTHLIRNHGLKTCPFKTHKRTYTRTHTLSLPLTNSHTHSYMQTHQNITQKRTFTWKLTCTYLYVPSYKNQTLLFHNALNIHFFSFQWKFRTIANFPDDFRNCKKAEIVQSFSNPLFSFFHLFKLFAIS